MTLHENLRADHERLDRLFDDLTNAAEGTDAAALRATWSAFESGLLAHIDAEEEHLLPRLEERAPEVVLEIREEHRHIRKLVAELGVMVDLHALRKETVDELVRSLRSHAAREDRTAYDWADALLDARSRRALETMLEEGRRRAAELPGRDGPARTDGHDRDTERRTTMTKAKAPLNKKEIEKELREAAEELQKTAGEIRLKIHLAGMDVKDAWSKLEPRVRDVEGRIEAAAEVTVDELRKLGADLKNHLQAIRIRVAGPDKAAPKR
jgi:hemerythrin superfamily protein